MEAASPLHTGLDQQGSLLCLCLSSPPRPSCPGMEHWANGPHQPLLSSVLSCSGWYRFRSPSSKPQEVPTGHTMVSFKRKVALRAACWKGMEERPRCSSRARRPHTSHLQQHVQAGRQLLLDPTRTRTYPWPAGSHNKPEAKAAGSASSTAENDDHPKLCLTAIPSWSFRQMKVLQCAKKRVL